MTQSGICDMMKSPPVKAWGVSTHTDLVALSQTLEEELSQKKREQEIFFKMSDDVEYTNPSSPNKLTKFLPYSESSTT